MFRTTRSDWLAQSERVRQGIAEVQATGMLNGKPTIIVSGRSDTLIPVNHAARAYYGANRKSEGSTSKLRYYEVTNAQHFDAFIDNGLLAGYDTNLVPLHVYFNRSMDIMYAHLKNGTALPDSQVIRTTPRGGTAGSAPAQWLRGARLKHCRRRHAARRCHREGRRRWLHDDER